MNLENPTSIITSATNAVAQITSLATEKLGPITTKAVEVVSRQVIVEATTLILALLVVATICFVATKLAVRYDAKITPSSSMMEDNRNGALSFISTSIAVATGIATLILLAHVLINVPTAIFNTEYATAEKFVEIFQKIKP